MAKCEMCGEYPDHDCVALVRLRAAADALAAAVEAYLHTGFRDDRLNLVNALVEYKAAAQAAQAAPDQLARLVAAVDRCESNRGRFSCYEAHDSRCLYAMQGAVQRGEAAVCACGALELDAAMEQARDVLAAQAARPATAGECDAVYLERSQVVAALSKLFPASLERHPDTDTAWEKAWRWIVFIDLPTGQASWHLHDSHLSLFAHLPRQHGRVWDGHTTPEKYRRLAALNPTPTDADVEAGARQLQDALQATVLGLLRSLNGMAMTRDIHGFRGESDYIIRNDGQRINFTIFDADAALAAMRRQPPADADVEAVALKHLLTVGHQETPCRFGGFVCLVCHEQDVTLTDRKLLKHDDECVVPRLLAALAAMRRGA